MKVQSSVVVTVKHGKKRGVAHKHRTVGEHHAALFARCRGDGVLEVVVNSAGRKALATARTHHLSVTISATVNGGTPATRRETIWTATKRKHEE